MACCDTVNRGAAYAGGKVFFNTLDDQTIAVDAKTGQEVWRANLGEIKQGETMTMAPLVAKDKVLVGNSGGEMGVRGWIAALDASTGKIAWRAYSTGPDADVLIGDQFHPFYEQDRGTDLGVKSWPPEAWKTGGSWRLDSRPAGPEARQSDAAKSAAARGLPGAPQIPRQPRIGMLW